MVDKKIMIRNSSATMTSTFITILLVMGIFFGGFAYLLYNTTESGQILDSKYSEMRDNLTAHQETLEEKTKVVRDNLNKMEQAEGVIQQVWNGITALGATILLGREFIPVTIGTYEAVVPGLSFIPTWAYALIYTGILIFIVFLIVKVVKGEPNM